MGMCETSSEAAEVEVWAGSGGVKGHRSSETCGSWQPTTREEKAPPYYVSGHKRSGGSRTNHYLHAITEATGRQKTRERSVTSWSTGGGFGCIEKLLVEIGSTSRRKGGRGGNGCSKHGCKGKKYVARATKV